MARAVVALLLAVMLTACGGAADPSPQELSANAQRVPDPPFDLAGPALIDSSGSAYDLAGNTSKPLTLVFFGYTNCPDICGQVMATLAGAMTRLHESDRDKVDVVFVTTDPARDTAEVVGDYVGRYNDDFIGLTGELDDIIALGRSVGVGVDHGDKLPSGGYEVTHGTQILALDGADQVPVYWGEDVSQDNLANDIHLLLAEG